MFFDLGFCEFDRWCGFVIGVMFLGGIYEFGSFVIFCVVVVIIVVVFII